MLTENQIKEFQQIYKEKYNQEISEEEAIEIGKSVRILAEIIVEQYIADKKKSLKTGVLPNGKKSKSFYR